MSVTWSRDEVILTTACVLENEDDTLSRSSPAIIALSEILNALPIVPNGKRNETFRTPSGLAAQIWFLRTSDETGERNSHIRQDFFDTYRKYKENPTFIISLANTIKACTEMYTQIPFGCREETEEFPEGALLGHLHRYFEQRDGGSVPEDARCEICGISATTLYVGGKDIHFTQSHLLAAPESMRPDGTYNKNDFIQVCPNCHRVLHQLRPWRADRGDCQAILHQ